MKDVDEKFSTQDIPLSGYLNACGHKILEQTKPDEFNRVSFLFAKSKSLLEDLYNYQTNATIPVQTFYRSLSYVWSLIKQGKKNNGKH